MTLLDVARFVEAPSAVTFALTCEAWGVDPAEEVEDPWLKHQLRLGLLRAIRKHQEPEDDEREESGTTDDYPLVDHRDRLAATRRKFKEMGY